MSEHDAGRSHLQPQQAGGLTVALVTCDQVPDLDDDDRPLVPALARRGVTAEPVVWDDPTIDWARFDLTVLRSTWDYTTRRDAFVTWARSVPRLANPAELIEWNSDKRYLDDLAAAGVSVVPSRFVPPGDAAQLPLEGRFVVKPSVGAGSLDTARFDAASEADQAVALVDRIHRSNRTALIQPYLDAVDDRGETALVRIDGTHSHAIRKDAILTGPESATEELFVEEIISAREPTAAELELAGQVADHVTTRFGLDRPPLYLRVDLLPGPDGAPLVLEVELVEPSLFTATAEGATDRLADAIAARLTPADDAAPT
jgi:glutathione synthase/RimK-type ligase-like ATP-grasp enzyme